MKRRHRLTDEKIRYGKVQEEVVALISQGFIHNKSHDDQRVPGHHHDDQSHHEHRQDHRQVAREDGPSLGHRGGQVAAGVGLQDVRAHSSVHSREHRFRFTRWHNRQVQLGARAVRSTLPRSQTGLETCEWRRRGLSPNLPCSPQRSSVIGHKFINKAQFVIINCSSSGWSADR